MGDAAGLPDYVLDPNAVLNDTDAAWRHGGPPDYSKTRAYYEESTPPTASTQPPQISTNNEYQQPRK